MNKVPNLPLKRIWAWDIRGNTCFEKVSYLERKWSDDINHQKFLPYLQPHEFESLLFTAPLEIANVFPEKQNVKERLENIRKAFNTPEEINDNSETIPSSRIRYVIPKYHGPLKMA